MVSDTRVAVAPLADLAQGVPVRVEGLDQPVVLVRIGDRVYGLEDRCSHQDVPLSEGDVWVEDLEIECHRHGSTFSLETGEALSLPATRPVPVYEVVVEGDTVYLGRIAP
jgi:3-phenylpropionate/trans-cinnamate dioxygenase ferredoxin component